MQEGVEDAGVEEEEVVESGEGGARETREGFEVVPEAEEHFVRGV